MKKLLAVLIASALFVPAMAASIFDSVETYGEIQTIGSLYNIGDTNIRDVSNRVLFGLSADLTEDVKAAVTFGNVSYWGTNESGTNGNSSLNDILDNVELAEGYVDVNNVFGMFSLKVGRQFYGDENSAVMYYGPNHYKGGLITTSTNSNNPNARYYGFRSVDGAVLGYQADNFAANIIYGKLAEFFDANGKDTDTSVMGFDAKYYMNDALALQAYLYTKRYGSGVATPPVVTDKTYFEGFWGAKADYSDDALSAAVEFAKNHQGSKWFQHNDGWMVKADASMDFAFENFDLTPRLGYTHSEQQFTSEGNFAPTIIYNGATGNSLQGLNLRMINAGVDFAFGNLDRFAFAFDYYAISSDVTADNPSWIGNEFNLWAKYAVNDYVELHAGLAYMTNSDYDDDPYAGQLGMIVKF